MRARTVVFWGAVLLLLVPAVLLTCTRVVEPEGGRWIQLEAFTPLAMVLYGVVLIVVLVRLLVSRRWRSAAAVVAVVAAAGLVLHAWWFSPQLIGSNPPPAADAEVLTVMTANLLEGSADGVEVVQRASEDRVGLLVVQEITAAELADMERAGLLELYPYRVGEPSGATDATMAFSREEITDVEPLGTVHQGWVFSTGDLRVMAVHPYSPTVPDSWRDDHAALAAAVAAEQPDLVVGDFNATADHAPMRALVDLGYRDVGELANQGWQPTWPSSGARNLLGIPVPSLVQIDHVLVGPRLAAISMRTVVIADSDHRAVLADVAPK